MTAFSYHDGFMSFIVFKYMYVVINNWYYVYYYFTKHIYIITDVHFSKKSRLFLY